jgi:hypothetical protein
MTRHELATLRFKQLALGLKFGADEERSDQWETWLRDDVIPVVEDLLDNPVFRRRILEIPKQLFTSPPQDRRARINALADALVVEAQTLVAVAREFDLVETLADHDRARDQDWIAEQAGRGVDTRSVIEKLAERPWFDVVNPNDFWTPSMDLYLRQPDALLTRQYRCRRSDWKLLGDHVIDLMFERFDFWKQRLDRGRQRLESRLGADKARFATCERMFACAIEVEQRFQDVRCDWREGNDARLRNACLVLLQAYIAYHAVPQLDWLGFDSHTLAAYGLSLRSFFRHQGTVILAEQKDDGRLHQVGTRPASLVDVQLIRQVAAAMEDLATLYHQGVHANDMIAEAKDQFRLVVVVSPRMVFWNGTLLELVWDKAEKYWNMMLHLAVKTEGKLPLHDFKLTGVKKHRDVTVRKSHLQNFLSRTAAGEELAARIDKPRGGDCLLDLEPADVKVFDLDADEWTVDVNEFLQANLPAAAGRSVSAAATPSAKARPR